jgi:hypothetical protein
MRSTAHTQRLKSRLERRDADAAQARVVFREHGARVCHRGPASAGGDRTRAHASTCEAVLTVRLATTKRKVVSPLTTTGQGSGAHYSPWAHTTVPGRILQSLGAYYSPWAHTTVPGRILQSGLRLGSGLDVHSLADTNSSSRSAYWSSASSASSREAHSASNADSGFAFLINGPPSSPPSSPTFAASFDSTGHAVRPTWRLGESGTALKMARVRHAGCGEVERGGIRGTEQVPKARGMWRGGKGRDPWH